MKNLLVTLLCAVSLVTPVFAQTPTVDAGKGFTLAWDYTQDALSPATGFKVELNGAQVDGNIPVTARQLTIPAIANCGANSIRAGAFNTVATTWSTALAFNVVNCAPAAPTNLRIIVSVTQEADGTFKLKLENVIIQ
jgi:hypothetical protein